MTTHMRLRQLVISLAIVIAALASTASTAFASHFRYGTISWRVNDPVNAPRVVTIRLDAAFRWSFSWSAGAVGYGGPVWPGGTNPPVGYVVGAASSLYPGQSYTLQIWDATHTTQIASIPMYLTVTSTDSINDIMTATFETTYTFPNGSQNYIAEFHDTARLTTLLDGNGNLEFDLRSMVTVRTPPTAPNRAPVGATLPILSMQVGVPNSFLISAYDPDNDPIVFSIPPTAETGLTATAPPGFSMNSAGSVVYTPPTNPSALGLHAVQVRVSDNKGAFTSIDLLLNVVSASSGTTPAVTVNGLSANQVFNVVRGSALTFTVNGRDPGNTVTTLSASPLPLGASMSPTLPTSNANGNVSSTFTWTPSPTQLGNYAVSYAATNGAGHQDTIGVTINVTNRQPTIDCTPSGTVFEATGPSGAMFSLSADIADLDFDKLSFNYAVNGIVKYTLGNITPPSTVTPPTPSGPYPVSATPYSYVGSVSDGFSTVTCNGTFTVQDTTPPTIDVPSDFSVSATGTATPVTFDVTATDSVDSNVAISCDHPSGSGFPVGATTVTCTATDDSSNTATGSFIVSVDRAATSLLLTATNFGMVAGTPIVVSAALNRTSPPAGLVVSAPVVFTFQTPSGSTVTANATTNGSGSATVSMAFTEKGNYSVSAAFPGSDVLLPSSSASSTIPLYQRTTITFSDSSTTAGTPTDVHAELRTFPQGTVIAGESITFQWGGAVPPQTAPTNSAGDAVTTVTFPIAGTYPGSAFFSNAAAFYADSSGAFPILATETQATMAVSPAVMNVSLTSPSQSFVGDSVTVTALLQRVSAPAGNVPNAALTFTLTGPTPSTQTVTTTAGGEASVTFSGLARGLYQVTASYAGDSGQAPASNAKTITVYQKTMIVMTPAAGVAGSQISYTGATLLAVPGNQPLAGQMIALSGTGGPTIAPGLAPTAGNGVPLVFLNYPGAGSFALSASFSNLADFFVDENGNAVPTTATTTAEITKAATAFTPLTVSDPSFVGDALMVVTSLSRVSAPVGPVENEPVTFTLTLPDSSVVTQSDTTLAGSGNAHGAHVLSVRGAHTARFDYAGNGAMDGASVSQGFTVYQKTLVSMFNANASAGSSVILSASLAAIPGGTALGSQTITFDFGGVIPSQSAITDGSGQANVVVTFPTAGTFTMTASFSNAADHFADHTGALATETATATITVSDPTPPQITHTILGTQGNNGYYTSDVAVSFAVVDNESAATTTGCDSTSTTIDGNNFSISCSATSAGGTSTDTVTFSRDTVAPSLTTSPNITVTSTSGAGAIVNYAAATSTDATSGVASVSCSPAAGQFPIGTTTVNCTAVDNAGHETHGSFTVNVTDSTPPVITPNVAGTLGNNGWYRSDIAVSFSVTDPESGIASSNGCDAASVTTDTAGITFTCTATNGAGLSSTQAVTVKRDTTAPSLTTSPNITAGATTLTGGPVSYAAATATDATSLVLSVGCVPPSGSFFLNGTTTVNCTATDNAGNTTTGAFTVTVNDIIPPVISSTTPSASSMWPPDHRMVPITIAVAATDNIGTPVCSVSGVTSNEPQNGLGDGDTPNDWLLTGGLTLQLRAERAGGGNGRVYTVSVRCVDNFGNATTSSTTVSVPKSQSK